VTTAALEGLRDRRTLHGAEGGDVVRVETVMSVCAGILGNEPALGVRHGALELVNAMDKVPTKMTKQMLLVARSG
jgi:hypothetical protein